MGGGRVTWRKSSTKEKSLFSLFAFEKESKRLMNIKGKLRRCIARRGVSVPCDVLQAVLCMVWARRCCGTELNPSTLSTSSTKGSVDMYLQQGEQHNPHSPRSRIHKTGRGNDSEVPPGVCVKENSFQLLLRGTNAWEPLSSKSAVSCSWR